MNDKIKSKVVNPQFADDNFKAKGLTFAVESTHETKDGQPINIDIQRIDAIYNPEFDNIIDVYRHPVMFKSAPYGISFADQGFVDNGRKIINLDKSVVQPGSKSSSSINDFAYQAP
jgi:hypothetical protein